MYTSQSYKTFATKITYTNYSTTTTQLLFILPDDINYPDQQATEIHQSTKHGSLTTNNNKNNNKQSLTQSDLHINCTKNVKHKTSILPVKNLKI